MPLSALQSKRGSVMHQALKNFVLIPAEASIQPLYCKNQKKITEYNWVLFCFFCFSWPFYLDIKVFASISDLSWQEEVFSSWVTIEALNKCHKITIETDPCCFRYVWLIIKLFYQKCPEIHKMSARAGPTGVLLFQRNISGPERKMSNERLLINAIKPLSKASGIKHICSKIKCVSKNTATSD